MSKGHEYKIIDLDKEYCIYPDLYGKLRHRCGYNKGGLPFSFSYYPIQEKKESYCIGCNKKIPPKIWTMYKLWEFHNA